MLTQFNGTIFSFGAVDLIHNKDHGATAVFGGSILLGANLLGAESRVYISNFTNYGAHAYAGGIIHFGNTSVIHTVSGGRISIRATEKGLITGQKEKVRSSSSQTFTDGLIHFY